MSARELAAPLPWLKPQPDNRRNWGFSTDHLLGSMGRPATRSNKGEQFRAAVRTSLAALGSRANEISQQGCVRGQAGQADLGVDRRSLQDLESLPTNPLG